MTANARKHLARRVRLLRTNRGWSQEVLAELSGLNRSYIGLDNIERISRALETSVPALLDSQETARRPPATGASATPPTAASPTVVIHKKVFLELLQQCGHSHRELVLVYLERCGVTLRD